MSFVLGILILVLAVVGLFTMVAQQVGVNGAIRIFVFAILTTAALVFAAMLVAGKIIF